MCIYIYAYTYTQYENIDRYFTYPTSLGIHIQVGRKKHPPRHPFDKLSDCVNSGGRVPVPGAYGTMVNFTPTRLERATL